MTIKRGADWGVARPLAPSSPVATSDAELAILAQAANPHQPIGLVGGDLARTLGATGNRERLYGSTARTVACDAMAISIDGSEPRFAVASLVIGSLRRGGLVVVANAAWLGEWNVNPRSHPNDGRVESIDMRELSIPDRVKARRRFPTGTHLPHPAIAVRSARSVEIVMARPTRFGIDGTRDGSAQRFTIEVLPDRFAVVI